MTIRYQCEECGSVLNIRDEKAGTTGHCPKCKAEFLVPSADEGAAPPASDGAASDGTKERSASSTKAAKPAAAAKPRKSGGDMDSDEIEQILEAKSPAAERGDYGVAGQADDDEEDEDDETEEDDVPEEDDDDDDDDDGELSSLQSRRKKIEDETDWDDDEDEEDRSGKKGRPSRREKPIESSGSAAGIAKGLMARGDKAIKLDERPGARHFGGKEGEEDDDDGFSIGERAAYFAKFLGPLLVLLAVLIGWLVWRMKVAQRGDVPDLGYVSGTVKMDGQPLANVIVQFSPLVTGTGLDAMKKTGSSSVGTTDANGKYVLAYTAAAEGATIGKHIVQITDPTGMVNIPVNYNQLSMLQEEVKAGSNTKDFDLASKPAAGTGAVGGFNPPGR